MPSAPTSSAWAWTGSTRTTSPGSWPPGLCPPLHRRRGHRSARTRRRSPPPPRWRPSPPTASPASARLASGSSRWPIRSRPSRHRRRRHEVENGRGWRRSRQPPSRRVGTGRPPGSTCKVPRPPRALIRKGKRCEDSSSATPCHRTATTRAQAATRTRRCAVPPLGAGNAAIAAIPAVAFRGMVTKAGL